MAQRTSQFGKGQFGAAFFGSTDTGGGSTPAFSISPSAGHTNGAGLTISVTYSGGATAPASGGVPFSMTGAGSITASSWVHDSSTSGHFTFTEGAVSGTPTVFTDTSGQSLGTQSFSNAAISPRAPTIGTVVNNQDGTVTVPFTPNADNGGSSVLTCHAYGSLGDNGSGTTGSSITLNVAVANKGVNQHWTVTQTNGVAEGPASGNSNDVACTSPPGVPTSVSASAGDTTASVTGTPPVDTGGLSLTYVADDGSAHATAAGSLPRSVTGLTNGTTYTPRLKARNTLGDSAFVASGNSVVPNSMATLLVDYPVLSSDSLGTKTCTTYDADGTLLTSGITTGYFDSGDGHITNAWAQELGLTRATDGSVAAVGVYGNINGTNNAAVELYCPPKATPVNFVGVNLSPWPASVTIGSLVAQTGTLGATTGSNIQFDAGGGTPFATGNNPVGQFILDDAGSGCMLITARDSDKRVHGTIIDDFAGTSLASNVWSFGHPSYKERTLGTNTWSAAVTSNIWKVPGVPKQFAAKITRAPDANGGYQSNLEWFTG